MGLFGPSKAEIAWREFADEIEGEYFKKGTFGSPKISARLGKWKVLIDTYTVSNGKSSTTYTRVTSDILLTEDFKFRIYKKSIFSGLGKAFGMEDIEIGEQYFDEQYIIKGSPQDKVIEFFSDQNLRQSIINLSRLHLQIKSRNQSFFNKDTTPTIQLYYEEVGMIKDKNRLGNLMLLFALSLKRLEQIGVITDFSG
jgi:hypothetical protein